MKRLFALIIAICFVFFGACDGTSNDDSNADVSKYANQFSLKFLDTTLLTEDQRQSLSYGLRNFIIADDRVMLLLDTHETRTSIGSTYGIVTDTTLHSYDIETGEYSTIDTTIDGCDYLTDVIPTDDGYILVGKFFPKSQAEIEYEDGENGKLPKNNRIFHATIENGKFNVLSTNGTSAYTFDTYRDGSLYYLNDLHSFRKYDMNGNRIASIDNPNTTKTGSGNSVVKTTTNAFDSLDFIYGQTRIKYHDGTYAIADFDNGTILPYEGIAIPSPDGGKSVIYTETPKGYVERIGLDGNIYLSDANGLYLFDGVNITEKVNWYMSNVAVPEILQVIDGDRLLVKIRDPLFNVDRFAIMSRVPLDELVPRSEISVAVIDSLTGTMTNQFTSFNLHNDKYRIIYTDYSKLDDPVREFNKDISSGTKYDLLVVPKDMNLSALINKGDLYDLSDKLGNNLLDSVKASYPDGEIYTLSPNMSIRTFVARSDYDVEDMTLYDGEAQLMYCDENYALNPAAIAATFINGTQCRFDSEEFVRLLEWAKNYEGEMGIPLIERKNYGGFIYEHSRALKSGELLTGLAYFRNIDSLFASYLEVGGDFKAIGYPTGGYAEVTDNIIYSVMNKGNCFDGAIAFIDFCLGDDFQSMILDSRLVGDTPVIPALPITKSGLRKYLDKYADGYYSTGNVPGIAETFITVSYIPINENTKYSNTPIPIDTKILDGFYDVINRGIKLARRNYDVEAIIEEELDAYISGAITSERCAELIQNRVSTLLAERS